MCAVTDMCGDVQELHQVRGEGHLRLTMNQLLEVRLQHLSSLVNECLGQITRDLLWGELNLCAILLYQLKKRVVKCSTL